MSTSDRHDGVYRPRIDRRDSVQGVPRYTKKPPGGWYVELEDCMLAVSMRVASTSTHHHLRNLGLTARTWRRGNNPRGKPFYGVIRDPRERAISGLRRYMGKKNHPITCVEEMIRGYANNGHVMPQTHLHGFVVEAWLPFEEYVEMLSEHDNKSSGLKLPEGIVFPDWFDEYFENDYEARRTSVSGLFQLPRK